MKDVDLEKLRKEAWGLTVGLAALQDCPIDRVSRIVSSLREKASQLEEQLRPPPKPKPEPAIPEGPYTVVRLGGGSWGVRDKQGSVIADTIYSESTARHFAQSWSALEPKPKPEVPEGQYLVTRTHPTKGNGWHVWNNAGTLCVLRTKAQAKCVAEALNHNRTLGIAALPPKPEPEVPKGPYHVRPTMNGYWQVCDREDALIFQTRHEGLARSFAAAPTLQRRLDAAEGLLRSIRTYTSTPPFMAPASMVADIDRHFTDTGA